MSEFAKKFLDQDSELLQELEEEIVAHDKSQESCQKSHTHEYKNRVQSVDKI